MPAAISGAISSAGLLQDVRVALENYLVWLEPRVGTRIRLAYHTHDLTMPTVRHLLNGFGLYGMEIDTVFAHGNVDTLASEVRAALPGLTPLDSTFATPADLKTWEQRGKAISPNGINLPPQEAGLAMPPPYLDRSEIKLTVPFLNAKELDIGVASEEVIVRMGHFRRHLLISGMEKGGNLRAKVEGKTLRLWVELEQ